MNRSSRILLLLLCLLVVGAPAAYAQGGGASQTGTITGRVTDNSEAVLPGVTVSISSPSLMGTQSAVTNESGLYRFPAVPPGTYTIRYELAGFSTLVRQGIDVSLGFTATVNVQLAVATLQETVTVTGESPVVDTSATRVQQNFKLEQLESIPNARDMWALLAVTPGVAMGRIDVGGNRAGTQTGYTAYGYGGQDQQVRVLVEGINTTEGTGGAGFYFDYGSFDEVFIGTAGQGAEMPHPGVQSQFLGKSGGNNFQGQVYYDYENNSLQASNIPDEFLARGIRKGSNEIQKYYDFNINVGGPIRKDRIWWYFSYRDQKNAVEQVNFNFDKTFDTRLWNPSGKVTYQLSQNNKFIGYYQWGQKIQPNRLWSGAFQYNSEADTLEQNSGSWVWKGEWNGTISDRLYVEARYGDFGYYFPLIGYSDETFRFDRGRSISEGGDRRWQQDRDRKQLTAAATYFKDNLLGGSHSFKFGGELDLETQWNGFQRIRADNIEHELFNGVSQRVVFGFPTADGEVGKKSSRKNLLHIAKLDQISAFLSDQWALGRVTLNLGVRFDHYKSHIPEQRQLAATTGPFSVAAQTFPAQTFFTWNSVVPRLGFIYDLAGDGKTVVKANYGYFKHNPGPGIASAANPNQAAKTVTYEWSDRNGNRSYDLGEEGLLLATALAGTISVDPDITQPYTHEFSAFAEREVMENLGVRVGFIYKTNDNLWQTYRPGRPIEAHTVPFSFVDVGVDGLVGTADDRTLTFFGLPRAQLSQFPANPVIMNVDAIGRYKSIEASLQKRFSRRWSANLGFGHTWTKENNSSYAGNTTSPSPFPNSPNDTSLNDFTGWGFNASGSYDAMWGLRLTGVFRHQAGQQYGRTATVTASAASGALYSGTILMEPLNSRRMDDFNILDARAERSIQLGGRNLRLRLFLDVFNILNTHSAEIISFATGTGFERPLNVVAPRTARVGFRFMW